MIISGQSEFSLFEMSILPFIIEHFAGISIYYLSSGAESSGYARNININKQNMEMYRTLSVH